MQTQQQQVTPAEVGRRLIAGEQGKALAELLGITETAFSRLRPDYYKAYFEQVINEAEAAKQALTQLQGLHNGLQKNCEKLLKERNEFQAVATELQKNATEQRAGATELQDLKDELKAIETDKRLIASQLFELETRLQDYETENADLETECNRLVNQLHKSETARKQLETDLQAAATELQDTRQQLQEVEEERDQYGATLQSLLYIRKPILEQRTLTHPRFLLWAIIGFEGYNGWQLLSNMYAQQFPFAMAVVFSLFFGLASVTALAANHRWGVGVCVLAAFVSNAIHAGLFNAVTLQGIFYTLLPCVLVLLFASMYRKNHLLTD